MHLHRVFAAIGLAATLFSSSASASAVIQKRSMTAPQIVENIKVVTTLSANLRGPAEKINFLSGALFLIGQGPLPQIISGFGQITQLVTIDIQQLQGTKPFSIKSDEKAILHALTTFVKIHQELLNILIGKSGLLSDLPLVGAPIAQVLRSLEGVVDAIAFGLIAVAPDVSEGLTDQKDSLDITITAAINAYTPTL